MTGCNKLVTFKVIAQKAGVSTATVSRAINNREKVSEHLYERIQDAMEALSYVPSEKPKEEVQRDREGRIVVLNIPRLGNMVFAEYIDGISAACDEVGMHLMINCERIKKSTQNEYLKMIKESRAIGLISLSCNDIGALKFLDSQIPVVQCMEVYRDIDIPYVCVDDYAASISAVEYLIATGRRNIGVVYNGYNGLDNSTKYRRMGYLEAIRRSGLEVNPTFDLHLHGDSSDVCTASFKQAISSFTGKPDAFFCCSDQIAHAALIALIECDYRVPQDVAVMGYDDSSLAKLTIPKLSSVGYSKFKTGYVACKMLYEKHINPSAKLQNIIMETQLVLRQST